MASENREEEITNTREYVASINYEGERSATSYRDDRIGRELPSDRDEFSNHPIPDKSNDNEDAAAAEDKSHGSERVAGTPSLEEVAEVERSQSSNGKHSAEEQNDSGEEDVYHSPLAESPAPPAKVSEYDEKMAEEPLSELLTSTGSLYPESRLVIGLAVLGILWVVAIIVLSAAGHVHKLLFPGDPTHDGLAGTTESSYTIDSRSAPRDPGSPFATRSRYSWSQQAVYVPLGIINSSVPSNATLFAFHLSRVAVRFFHSLVPLLRQEPAPLGASYNLQYTNRSQTLFGDFLNCLSRDLSTVLRQTRAEFDLDPDDAGYALLAQTVAVALAFVAFRELLHVEHIWKLSFRLNTLRDLSSDQLFFVSFALDNCENSDATYQIRQYQWWKRLPPEFAVNFPLRHLPHSFGEAFNCPPGSFMRPSGNRGTCNIFNTTANYHVLS
ncbi:hypothetical protein MTO96_012138 [Rhipicephalus appendiculatus]